MVTTIQQASFDSVLERLAVWCPEFAGLETALILSIPAVGGDGRAERPTPSELP